jgi:hypothetical protein
MRWFEDLASVVVNCVSVVVFAIDFPDFSEKILRIFHWKCVGVPRESTNTFSLSSCLTPPNSSSFR